MQTQLIINHDAVPCLLNLLTGNYKKSIKKEACWTISNITAGNKEQIQAVILYMLQISCSGLPLCIISKAKSMTWVLSKVNTCIMDKAVFSHVQNVRIIHVYVVILRASQHCFRDITGWLTGNLQYGGFMECPFILWMQFFSSMYV